MPRLPVLRALTASIALGLLAAATPACGAALADDATDQTDEAWRVRGVVAAIEANPTGSGSLLARIGPSRYALTGDRSRELAIGRRYKLSLVTTADKVDGFEVRRVLDLSPVKRLVGTIEADARSPALMQLESLHAKRYALEGATVTAYNDIARALPEHDYSATLFAISAVQGLGGDPRWDWLDYAPLPLFECADTASSGAHLDLVDVKPGATLLDGFINTPLGGREVRVGAHAACSRDGDAYACTLDVVGSPWGTSRFVPSAAPFDITIDRADTSKLVFACTTFTRAARASLSED